MKNKTFWQSIKCAVKGAIKGFRSEKNFWIYLGHVLLTLPLNIWLQFNYVQHAVYAITVFGVFATEYVNTAIEKLCNRITEEKDDKIRDIKDIAAAAVSVWGLAFYLAEIINVGLCIFVYP